MRTMAHTGVIHPIALASLARCMAMQPSVCGVLFEAGQDVRLPVDDLSEDGLKLIPPV